MPTKKKTTEKNEEITNKPVVFVSRQRESYEFEVAGYRPIRNFNDNMLEWHVNPDDVERFSLHHHVVGGRIIKKK